MTLCILLRYYIFIAVLLYVASSTTSLLHEQGNATLGNSLRTKINRLDTASSSSSLLSSRSTSAGAACVEGVNRFPKSQVTGKKTVLAIRVIAGATNKQQPEVSKKKLKKVLFLSSSTSALSLKNQIQQCSNYKLRIAPDKTVGKKGIYDVRLRQDILVDKTLQDGGTDAIEMHKSLYEFMSSQFNLEGVDFIIMVFPHGTWFDPYQHISTDEESQVTQEWAAFTNYTNKIPIIVFNNKAVLKFKPLPLVHEFGHTIGLGHSREIGAGNGPDEYEDRTGNMGIGGGQRCFNGAKSWQLGWYKANEMCLSFGDLFPSSSSFLVNMAPVVDISKISDDHTIVLRLASNTEDTLAWYLQYNKATDFNQATKDCIDGVAITTQHDGVHDSNGNQMISDYVGCLNVGERLISGYVGIEVLDIASDTLEDPSIAKVCVYNANSFTNGIEACAQLCSPGSTKSRSLSEGGDGCPIWTQKGNSILGEYGASSGRSISLSNDGDIIAIGSPQAPFPTSSGRVSVYKFIDGSWLQLGESVTGMRGDMSGHSVTMSGDGSTFTFESQFKDLPYVRVFRYDESLSTWEQFGDTIYGSYGRFGSSTSLSDDGSIVAISSPQYPIDKKGQVQVFRNVASSNWEQLGPAIDGEDSNNFAGASISLSSDGLTIAIGSPGNSINAIYSGQTRIFSFIETNNTWQQIGNSINGNIEGGSCGSSVSLSSDGSIVAILCHKSSGVNVEDPNKIRVYKYNSGSWEQLGQELSGISMVSLSSDGETIALNDFDGIIRVYDYISSSWQQKSNDLSALDVYWNSVSLSGNGYTCAIGSPNFRVGNDVFNPEGGVSIYQFG